MLIATDCRDVLAVLIEQANTLPFNHTTHHMDRQPSANSVGSSSAGKVNANT